MTRDRFSTAAGAGARSDNQWRKRSSPADCQRINRPVGWPTIGVAFLIYSSFALITWFHNLLPAWLLLFVGGYVVAWHTSLQHEVVHGHPTRLPWINRLLVFPNLVLWLPFEHYRDSHIRHHRDDRLTDPLEDPESWYLTAERWARTGRWLRSLLWINNTVSGRLLLGPLLVFASFMDGEFQALRKGSFKWQAWLLNLASVGLVLSWVLLVCGLPFWTYLLLFIYPGTSLTLLRSFPEHRARSEPAERTVVVEAGLPMALLYLNNNLHAAHHRFPGEPWFRLPAIWRRERADLLKRNGGYHYSGYAEITARYLLWPKEPPVYPGASQIPQPPAVEAPPV